MRLVYTDQNRLLVEHARNVVENAGIEVTLRNEWVGGASGEVAPTAAWLEVWVVEDADEQPALAAIEAAQRTTDGPDRVCANCGEASPAGFAQCWNCEANF